jgi:hypothetical protein
MRARSLLVRALVALAIATTIFLSVPSASASCVDDNSCTDVGSALQGGFAYIVERLFSGAVAVFGGIFGGFVDLVVKPFLGIFGGFFGGIGAGLNSAGNGLFAGAAGAMGAAYARLAESLFWAGPLAPILAAFVILAVIVMVVLVVGFLFRLALKSTEREVKDTVEGAEDE